jgi:hypothetical protein
MNTFNEYDYDAMPEQIADIYKAKHKYESEHATPFDCCVCHKQVKQFGNNALPIKQGKCCNRCNEMFVIPVRAMIIRTKSDIAEMNQTK